MKYVMKLPYFGGRCEEELCYRDVPTLCGHVQRSPERVVHRLEIYATRAAW